MNTTKGTLKKVQAKEPTGTSKLIVLGKKPTATVTKTEAKPISGKKQEVVKSVTPINKATLIEKVIANREVKYIYPEDVNDTLSRKSWRQTVRAELNKLEMTMLKITDQKSKSYAEAKKAYEDYHKKVMKVQA